MDDIGGLRDLRRLRIVGVLAPVAFLAAFEAFRIGIIDAILDPPASNAAGLGVAVVAALGFGIVIFLRIDRAQRAVLRRNRDLAVVNRVAAATRGELDVEAALHGALVQIVDATGAIEATATLRPVDRESGADRTVTHAPPERAGDALMGPTQDIHLTLATNGVDVGHLTMRIPASRVAAMPSPEALRIIADQLATTLHIGQLVADLHSRRSDGHVFYQALVQISNQAPLAETIATIAGGARSRLGAEESRICLTPSVLDALEMDPAAHAEVTGGNVCETTADGRRHACPIGLADDRFATLSVPLTASGELLGDLWVARSGDAPFTERDRRYLLTLGGIATIAIVGARAWQQERQGAILAERDRIARELHDSLAQVLGSTHLRLRHLLRGADLADRPGVAEELESLADVAEEAYRDVREAILGLREASRPRDFLEALLAYTDKYAMLSGVQVELETTTAAHPSIAVGTEIQVLRVIQEALTNVRKHAQARTARVLVTDGPADGLMVVIEDDGRGFDPAAARLHRDGGFGLETMRERMELVGGSLRVDSSPSRGTRVIACVPGASTGRTPAVLADHR